MFLTSPFEFIALVLIVVLIGRRIPDHWAVRTYELLTHSRLLPMVAGVAVALLTTWIWGGLRAPAVVHDESAYLLQAQLLAAGHWATPSPPVLAPFTQAAVLITPAVAPKMPPGHALALIPGIWLGLPGLMPMILIGLSAGLLVSLVRRVHGAALALLVLALWLTQSGQSRWRASYMSESTTAALWLGGWWCLLRWRETRRSGWLLALAGMAGWGAITRPLTMLLFAIPVAVVVLRDAARCKLWGQVGAAIVVGALPLVIMPMQNAAITGNWRHGPLPLYTRQYMPFDRVGFGLDSTPPALVVPGDIQSAVSNIRDRHREHVPAALPAILWQRLELAVLSSVGGWRLILILPALFGLFCLSRPDRFAVATMLLVYVGYLIYAHEPHWTVYYVEVAPIFALVIGLGMHRLLQLSSGSVPRAETTMILASIAVVLAGAPELSHARVFRAHEQQPIRQFAQQLDSLKSRQTLVFIRYAAAHDPNISFVRNVADPTHAPAITAYDLGPATNSAVAARFPTRVPYLWDESTQQLQPIVQ